MGKDNNVIENLTFLSQKKAAAVKTKGIGEKGFLDRLIIFLRRVKNFLKKKG